MLTKTLLAAALVLGAATPALAGPAGTGLGLTEEVARKAYAERKAAAVKAQAQTAAPAVVAAR